ncbi:MAG TPA: hypothetical protein VFM32_03215 [Spongiibacteraceae bacterium]|nr:hypothetical protein [Spongiibacteraceae bacterium]
MNTFSLSLQDATHTEHIERVTSFIGSDASGTFALWSGHERMITELEFGLARFRTGNDVWQYLAVPGALLYFCDNTLTLCSRRFVRGDDFDLISNTLREQLQSEERDLQRVKTSLRQMEDAVLKRLYELNTRRAT